MKASDLYHCNHNESNNDDGILGREKVSIRSHSKKRNTKKTNSFLLPQVSERPRKSNNDNSSGPRRRLVDYSLSRAPLTGSSEESMRRVTKEVNSTDASQVNLTNEEASSFYEDYNNCYYKYYGPQKNPARRKNHGRRHHHRRHDSALSDASETSLSSLEMERCSLSLSDMSTFIPNDDFFQEQSTTTAPKISFRLKKQRKSTGEKDMMDGSSRSNRSNRTCRSYNTAPPTTTSYTTSRNLLFLTSNDEEETDDDEKLFFEDQTTDAIPNQDNDAATTTSTDDDFTKNKNDSDSEFVPSWIAF